MHFPFALHQSLQRAESSLKSALDDGRELTNRERALVGEGLDEIQAIRRIGEYMSRLFADGAKGAGSVGDAFVKSDAFRRLQSAFKSGNLAGNWTSGSAEIADFFSKATVTSTASPIVPVDVQGGINPLLGRCSGCS